MAEYKTYRKEKWIYFALSIVAYFLPFIITTACFLPIVSAPTGIKAAIGMGILLINAIPFLTGVFRAFFAHFPMLNMLAIVFMLLYSFFALDIFTRCREIICWIELSAAIGSVASCILWGKYLKYKSYQKTIKATVKSGAFLMRGK